jgi:hypothetical protein
MKKKIAVIFLFLYLVMSVAAQSSATVSEWLRQALNKSTTALNLARRDYNANKDTIGRLYEEILDLALRFQNYFNQGNMPTDSQLNTWNRIIANINEINQRMAR